MHEMLFSRKASQFVKTLQKSYKEKIRDVLKNLMENPFSYPYKDQRENKCVQDTCRRIQGTIQSGRKETNSDCVKG